MREIMAYPSPQASSTTGPFFGHSGNDPGSIADELPQLQQHQHQQQQHDDSNRDPMLGAHGVPPNGGPPFMAQNTVDEHISQGAPHDRIALSINELQQQSQQLALPEHASLRRKPKNSKACDECRRKKVRLKRTLLRQHILKLPRYDVI